MKIVPFNVNSHPPVIIYKNIDKDNNLLTEILKYWRARRRNSLPWTAKVNKWN